METHVTMSEAIVNAPTVILAGAGASAHLGYPVASEFLEDLAEAVGNQPASCQGIWAAAQVYCDPEADYGEANFEDIHDRLAALCESPWGYGGFAFAEGYGGVSYPGVEDMGESLSQMPGDDAKRLQEMMVEEIVRVFGKPPPQDETVTSECWPNVLSLVHPGCGQLLPVFTTNYDVALEKWFSHQHQGRSLQMMDAFVRHAPGASPWEAQRYQSSPAELLNAHKAYVWLFHLHGCAAWFKAEDLGLNPSEYTAPAYYYTAPDGSQSTVPFPAKRALISPSRKKRPFEDPYWTEYWHFLRCLGNAQLLLIIGHGLEDPHIVFPCSKALSFNRELRIVVISLDADESSYRQRLPVAKEDRERVAFIKLPFKREPMSKLGDILHDRPLDIEAALRAVAWCSNGTTQSVTSAAFCEKWQVHGPQHAGRWKIDPSRSEVVYQAVPGTSGHGFYVRNKDGPSHVLEGEVTIGVDVTDPESWGAIALAWEESAEYPKFYAIENQAGDVKLKFSDGNRDGIHEELKDLRHEDLDGPKELKRRIWFRISKKMVQIATLTNSGQVRAAYRHIRKDTLGPPLRIALAATQDPKHSIVFRDLKLIDPTQ